MRTAHPDNGVSLVSAEYDSAEYLAAIVENSDDAVVSKDLDGKILSWNDAATTMYGYTAEEAIGRQIEIVIPENPARLQEELDIRARIARGERVEHYETIRRRKDGSRVEVSLSISPVRNTSGEIVAAAGFARDITERRVFQAAQYLAAIVENSDDAIVSEDLDGKILSWNDAATTMYGYTAKEAIGRQINIVIPEDPARLQEELDIRARIDRGERIEHYETIRRRKDGSRVEVSLSISPVRDASGEIVAAAGFARDITERRVFQAAQYLAAIVENSDDAVVSKDLDGKILSWNDAATTMYGYTAEEAIGRQINIVIPEDPDALQEELDIRDRIARGERIEHYETIRRRKDGSQVEVSMSISPVRNSPARSWPPPGSPATSPSGGCSRPPSTWPRSWTTPTTPSCPWTWTARSFPGTTPPPRCTATPPRRQSAGRSPSSSPATRTRSRRSSTSGPGSTAASASGTTTRSAAARTASSSRSRCPSPRCATPLVRLSPPQGSPAISRSGGGLRTNGTARRGCWRASPISARTTSTRRYTISSGIPRPLRR